MLIVQASPLIQRKAGRSPRESPLGSPKTPRAAKLEPEDTIAPYATYQREPGKG